MTHPAKARDTEYDEYPIGSVERESDGYSISRDGWYLWLPDTSNPHNVVPKVGDTARYYGGGIGYPVRGVDINGVECYYQTADEYRAEQLERIEQDRQERRYRFYTERESYDTRIAALPKVFRDRMKKFQDTNPDFDWEYGGYELMCCEQAVLIAGAFDSTDKIKEFHESSWERQLDMLPGLDEGHSGNTFGFACTLAAHYLTNPENVVLEHGAMTPLTGCEDYGCPHPYDYEYIDPNYRERSVSDIENYEWEEDATIG